MTSTPTLLIGLGGLGSQIVDSVYGMLDEQKRTNVIVHAFDTDVDSLEKLTHLKGNATQTSSQWTVMQYYERAQEVRTWFPDYKPSLKELFRKSLTEGAGQIRMISRLAWRSAIAEGRLKKLEQQISQLFLASGVATEKNVRIIVVCTLAGGTGSGIFLQVAMFLRELFTKTFGRERVLVRGAFILPDILVKTNTLDAFEVPSVQANGYACLKELDAITQAGSGEMQTTIELEYRPEQVDVAGHQSLEVSGSEPPYDFSFLFDYENTQGKNLGALRNYLDQVAKCTYLQMFTPLSGRVFSQEDNHVKDIIKKQGRNRYCGAAVATMNYPYHDLINYCALRMATDQLSDQWLKVDESYEEEVRQFELDIKNGINRERPKRGPRFIFWVNQLGIGDAPEPFFKKMYRSLFLAKEKGAKGEPKAELFMDSLLERIKTIVKNDEVLNSEINECVLDVNRLKNKERAVSEVSKMEHQLTTLRTAVLESVAQNRVFLSNEILFQDYNESGRCGGQAWRLNTWLLRQPEPIHPVAVRYFLYQVQEILEQKLIVLRAGNQKLQKKIDSYEKVYDKGEEEGYVQTAEDRIRDSLKGNWFFKNKFKDFVDEYEEGANTQKQALLKFLNDKLTEYVLDEIFRNVKGMLERWERFFYNLREVRNHLHEERNQVLHAHDRAKVSDRTKIFVFATPDMKNKLWEDVRIQFDSEDLPAEITEKIYVGQYDRYCALAKRGIDHDEGSASVETMFREDVLQTCRESLYGEDRLNMNVIEALQKQAVLLGQNAEQYLKLEVESLDHLAQPLVPKIHGLIERAYWGVHPAVLRFVGEKHKDEIFGEGLIVDDAFKQHEIIRYRGLYSIKAEDLPKFSSGSGPFRQAPGSYFAAYKKAIRALMHAEETKEEIVSPHLDKNWHLPAFMPDLNTNEAEADRTTIDRAFVLGLVYKTLSVVDEEGQQVWLFQGEKGNRMVRIREKPIPAKLAALHGALSYNPVIVSSVIQLAEEQTHRDCEDHQAEIENHAFIAGIHANKTKPSVLDALLELPEEATLDAKLPEKSLELIRLLLEEIRAYHTKVFHGKNIGRIKAVELVDTIFAQSKHIKQLAEDSKKALDIKSLRINWNKGWED